MPDSELLKVLIQAGSFGLVALIGVVALFRGIQAAMRLHQETVADLVKEHKAAIVSVASELRAEMREQRAWHAAESAKRDGVMEKLTEAVERMGERVDGVVDRLDKTK